MKKSTKGAAAAATAGVLLLGGAGTLAFWTSTVNVAGGSISSGHLTLDDNADCANAPWTLDDDEDVPNAVFNPGADKIVPGDVLTKTCIFTVNASGEHLRAQLAATGGAEDSGTNDLNAEVSVSSSFTVDGVTDDEITEEDAGKHVEATIQLTFPYGTEDNGSQDDTVSIGQYTVTATQVHDN